MIFFEVPGPPVGKQRPRVTRGRTFTPKKTRAYEASIAMHARMAGVTPSDGPVHVRIMACMPDKRRRDLDNVIKAVLDGLNGVAYHDDAQVTQIVAEKTVDRAHPATLIAIMEPV